MKERFYNSGSSAYSGLKYLFEGEYNAQMADNNGGISFDYNSNVAQLRSESHVSSAGLLKNYPVDSVLEVKSINDMVKDSKEEFSEDIQKLKTGVAIGLSQSAHAMTLFGYIIDSSLQGFNSVKALFLADSDNHAYEYEDIDHPPEGMIPKENLPNTYTMYTELSDPSSEEPVGIHVESWLLLKPSSAVSKTETPPAGCCASNTVDLVAYSLAAGEEMQWVVHSNAVVGTTIKLSAEFQNASYKAIDFSKVPQIQGTIAVLLNGESHQTIPVTYTLLESDCEANAKTAYTVPYHIESAGSYSFQFSIEGIFYNDGTKAVELYQYNNVCHKLCTVTVPAQAVPSDRTGIPTYFLTLSKANGVFEIVFPAVCSDFGCLMLNGNPVDSALYSISSLQDGMFRLCFSKELIDSLSAGSSTFTLFNLNGQPVAFFVIEK